jgi:hypothetical protein
VLPGVENQPDGHHSAYEQGQHRAAIYAVPSDRTGRIGALVAEQVAVVIAVDVATAPALLDGRLITAVALHLPTVDPSRLSRNQ